MKLTEKLYTIVPERFLADEERVVILSRTIVAGESSTQVNIFTYRNGKLAKIQSVLDTFSQQIFSTK
jgi:hypothetical protein